jgi:hypothetical protein
MKQLIVQYLENFAMRWDFATTYTFGEMVNLDRKAYLEHEYANFIKAYNLPELPVDELLYDIEKGRIEIK